MIYIVENNIEEEKKSILIPSPKHIWIDANRIVIYTEEDIPITPT